MSKLYVPGTWGDAHHIEPDSRKDLLASVPLHQRDARERGAPSLGSGAIFPVPESGIIVEPFEIPPHWPRAYGLDVGWNRTAAVWAATDRDTGVTYLYDEHYLGQAEPSVHATAIRARGEWIPGAIDPAARGRGQADGRQLLQAYLDLGLDLTPAVNAVEAGIHAVWLRLSAGRLKVFRSCTNWLGEYRVYRRDEAGRIVKQHDHLMDATRYLALTGLALARTAPARQMRTRPPPGRGGESWLGA